MKTIEIKTTITRDVRHGTGLASKRVDIFEVDCVAVIEYSFDGSWLDWNPIAFRFETLRGDAHETLGPDDNFFPALEAALDREWIEQRIAEEDEEYAAACAKERKAEQALYRARAL